jgi:two-component system KDP operon response regulator KdpE
MQRARRRGCVDHRIACRRIAPTSSGNSRKLDYVMQSFGSVPHEILIIEDDTEIRRFLRTTLSAEHYRLREAATATEGLSQFDVNQPDVIVLDLGLPDADGLEVIRRIRKVDRKLPIIVLSVRSDERDKILALDTGADDFVNKPFAIGELLARLRVALRRTSATHDDGNDAVFRAGEIEVDLKKRRIHVRGVEIHLTRIEYKLLQVLIRHADHVVTHGQLLKEVWGPNHEDQIHYLRVYMLQLRRKLEADPTRPRYLRTEAGIGYRLVTED